MGRRDNGTGYIYQRENGTWCGRIYIGTNGNGGKKYKNFSGKTQGEVKRKIREYNKSENGEDLEKVCVHEYITNWLKTYKYGSVKSSSYDALERTASIHILPTLGMINLRQVDSADIQNLLICMKDKEHLSYSTVKKAYDLLNAVFNHATIAGDIVKNPMLLVKMPDSSLFSKKEIRIFNNDECRLITEECRRKYSNGAPVYIYGDAYILIMNTGLRMGEAIGLLKSDYDKERNSLHIQRNIQSIIKRDKDGRPSGGKILEVNTTKTYSGDRYVPLNKTASEALVRLCEAHPNSKNIICSSKGDPVPPERLDRTFYRILNNINIEKTGVHSLRHTFASMLFANKVDVKTVSKLLGHANIQITLNTYIHLMGDTTRDAVDTLELL